MERQIFTLLVELAIVGCLAVNSAHGAARLGDFKTWDEIYQETFVDNDLVLKPLETIERLKQLEAICYDIDTKECIRRRNRVGDLLPLSDLTTLRCEKEHFSQLESMIRKESNSRNIRQYLIDMKREHGLMCLPIFQKSLASYFEQFGEAERDLITFLKDSDDNPHSTLPGGIVLVLQRRISGDLDANNFAKKFNIIKKICSRVQKEYGPVIEAVDLITKDSFVLKMMDDSVEDQVDELKICSEIMKNSEQTFSEAFEIFNIRKFEQELKLRS